MDTPTFSSLELSNTTKNRFGEEIQDIKTASQWFCHHFPDQANIYGAPFLENKVSSMDGFSCTSPAAPNLDFFAACLGGDKRLGHSVVYWPAECQFYYLEPLENVYHPCPDSKLGDLMKGYFARCALEVQKAVDVYHLFITYRSDPIIKSIVGRAKSILRASENFFSANSPVQRIRGVELHERLARVFVEDMLTSEPGQILKLHDAYNLFCALVKQRDLSPIKRSDFKAVVGPLIREQFDVALRNDLSVADQTGVRGWKGVKLIQSVPI